MARLRSDERLKLVESHLRLAYFLARRVEGCGLDLEDREQAAALGLCAAATAFDPDAHPGVPFSAFARDYIIRHLTDEVSRHVRSGLHASLGADVEAPGRSRAEARLDGDVWEAMESLTAFERRLVSRRFGLGGTAPAGLLELSFELGVPVRSLSRLLAIARRKLGESLRARGWTERSARYAAYGEPRIKMA